VAAQVAKTVEYGGDIASGERLLARTANALWQERGSCLHVCIRPERARAAAGGDASKNRSRAPHCQSLTSGRAPSLMETHRPTCALTAQEAPPHDMHMLRAIASGAHLQPFELLCGVHMLPHQLSLLILMLPPALLLLDHHLRPQQRPRATSVHPPTRRAANPRPGVRLSMPPLIQAWRR